jgi:hypothetical protein
MPTTAPPDASLAVLCAAQLPIVRKLELILLYFGVRKCSTHFVSMGFFCTLVPLTVFTPEVGGCRGDAVVTTVA